MNKQDLKEGQEVYVKGKVIHTGDHLDIVLANGSFIENAIVLHHKKPVVPQYVADFIAEQKKQVYTLSESIDGNMPDRVAEWYWDNSELFTRAWLDGYEIEKEKRYLIKVVGMDRINGYLIYNKDIDKWSFGMSNESKTYRTKHTRKELEEAGFGWIFSCEGIEIEEVEG